jgi:hypothetical protein
MVRQAVRQAHGPEQSRRTHHPEPSRRVNLKFQYPMTKTFPAVVQYRSGNLCPLADHLFL